MLGGPQLDYDKAKTTQTIKGGNALIIPVNVSGLPKPTTSWSLNGQTLESSDIVSIETSDAHTKLTVKPVSSIHSGTFTVTATNEVDTVSADFTVTVKGELILSWFFLYNMSIAFLHFTRKWMIEKHFQCNHQMEFIHNFMINPHIILSEHMIQSLMNYLTINFLLNI